MLPFDSFYATKHAMGASGSSVIFSVPSGETWTILSAVVERSDKSPHTYITAGGNTFFIHTGSDFSVNSDMVFPITGDVVLNWSGAQAGTHHFTALNYVKYDLTKISTTTSQSYNPSTQISSSTDIQVYGSITAGEMFISVLLFAMIFITLLKMLFSSLDRIKTRRQYIAYSNSDVEIRDEI